MSSIKVRVDGDHEQTARDLGLTTDNVMHTTAEWTVDALVKGMTSGKTSIMLLIPVRWEGRDLVVAAETSLNMWMQATAILRSKFQDEVEDPGYAIVPDTVKRMLIPRYVEVLRRVVPTLTPEQAEEAATMFMDAISAGAPDEYFENP
jgi:hypothetical protein